MQNKNLHTFNFHQLLCGWQNERDGIGQTWRKHSEYKKYVYNCSRKTSMEEIKHGVKVKTMQ